MRELALPIPVARMATRLSVRPVLGPQIPVRLQRAVLDFTGRSLPAAPVEVRRMTLGGVPAERVTGPGARPSHTILYLHGGGYVIGSPQASRPLTSRLAQLTGAEVIVLDYRLAPEHPFPAALQDALGAYRALLAAGAQSDRITLVGDSAGGGLALSTAIAIRDQGVPPPRSLVLISPWLDLTLSGETIATQEQADPCLTPAALRRWSKLYLNGHDPADPACSPLFGDHLGLPPILVQVGSEEILRSDSERLAAADDGVTLEVYPGLWHDFQLFAGMIRVAREALQGIAGHV